jgi:hypothetical protein
MPFELLFLCVGPDIPDNHADHEDTENDGQDRVSLAHAHS